MTRQWLRAKYVLNVIRKKHNNNITLKYEKSKEYSWLWWGSPLLNSCCSLLFWNSSLHFFLSVDWTVDLLPSWIFFSFSHFLGIFVCEFILGKMWQCPQIDNLLGNMFDVKGCCDMNLHFIQNLLLALPFFCSHTNYWVIFD